MYVSSVSKSQCQECGEKEQKELKFSRFLNTTEIIHHNMVVWEV